MNTDRSQRWRERRDLYCPAGEVFNPSRFGVAPIYSDNEAAAFIERHHYSASFPSAVHRFGLYHKPAFLREELVGVAVFGIGCNKHIVPCYAPGLHPREGLELSRLVLRDECADGTVIAGNAETWMLGRVFDQLRLEERRLRRADKTRRPVRIVLAYSDPIPRRTEEGRLVLPGHIGQAYQAFSGRFIGRATARKLYLDTRGCVVSERAFTKIAAEDDPVKGKGHRYSYQQLLRAGCPVRRPGESGAEYVERVKTCGALREVEHPGNLVYGWPLTNAGRDALRPAMTYPTLAEFGLPVT